MPNYARLQIVGRITPAQTWSTGISFALVGGSAPGAANLAAFLNAAAARVTTWWSGGTDPIQVHNAADTSVTGLRLYVYSSGLPGAIAQAEYTYATPLVGVSSASAPTQTCIVHSTLTGVPGRRNRGRGYVPATGILLASHQLSSARATGLAQKYAAMLTGLNADATTNGLGAASVAGSASILTITQVRVDSEPDIQRRHANKIVAGAVGIANV